MTFANLGIAVTSNAEKAAVDLDKLTASAGRAQVGVTQLAGAATKTAAATSQISMNSANIAAQLQDVAVSAQMGMNPLQIALQQGTQLSAVLNQVRGSGVSVGAALATSFASIVNPISLATLGVIAFGSFGIQALSSLVGQAMNATDALERHGEELKRIVSGYGDAEGAIKEFLEASARLPREAVQIQLGGQFAEMSREASAFIDKAGSLGAALSQSTNQFDQGLGRLLLDFRAGKISASDLVVELTRIENSDLGPLGFMLKGIVTDLRNGAQVASAFEQSLVAVSHALAATAVNGGLQMALDSSIQAKRSAQAHEIEMAAIAAKTPAQMADIAMRRERLKLVDEEISEALREQKVREAGELAFAKASARSGTSAVKDFDQWKSSVGNFQKRIDQQQAEIDLFGKGTYEIERQKAKLDLLNEARQAGIKITDDVTATIERMSGQYATATAELERLQYQQQQIDQLNSALASGFADLFIGILDGSKSAEQGIADLLGSLGRLLINQAFQSLFAPVGVGGGGFNPFGMLFGGGRATGGPVEAGKVYRINENTPNSEYFAPAVSGTVIPANDNPKAGGDNDSMHITVGVSVDSVGNITPYVESVTRNGIQQFSNRELPGRVQAINANPYRKG